MVGVVHILFYIDIYDGFESCKIRSGEKPLKILACGYLELKAKAINGGCFGIRKGYESSLPLRRSVFSCASR